MIELHSNFTIDGSKAAPGSIYTTDGTYPTNHQKHETVEISIVGRRFSWPSREGRVSGRSKGDVVEKGKPRP